MQIVRQSSIADSSLGGGGGAAVLTVTTAANTAHTFTGGASSTGSGASLTYQWQKAESGSTNFADFSGKT